MKHKNSMRNIMHFLVFYLRGCDKEEVLPNEIACKEIVHLERRNMEHLFCKEWPPPHLVALDEEASSILWSICSKIKIPVQSLLLAAPTPSQCFFLLCWILSNVSLFFVYVHLVIFRQTWNLSNFLHDRIFGPTILQKHVYCSYFFANNKAAYMSI